MKEKDFQKELYDQKFDYIKQELAKLSRKMDDLSGVYVTKAEYEYLKKDVEDIKGNLKYLLWAVLGGVITMVFNLFKAFNG